MRSIITIALVFLVSFFTYSQSKVFDIGFLLDFNNTEIEILLDQLKEEIKAVVGEDATVRFSQENRLVNGYNLNVARTNYNTLLNNDTDIIIAFGAVNNTMISKIETFEKPTILFGTFSKELLTDDAINAVENKVNLTTILTNHSITRDLELLIELVEPEKVVTFIEKAYRDNQPIDEVFTAVENRLGIDIDIVSFSNLNDILNNLTGYDAVYMMGGFYLSESEIKTLADKLIEKKLPSFTSTSVADVELGLMAANQDQTGIDQFFRRIALTVENVINEGAFEDAYINLDTEETLTLNFTTAEKVGVDVKYSLIATTNFVGNPKDKLSDKQYSLEQVMREAVSRNLELETARQEVLLNEKDVQVAKSDYLPNITATASGSYVDPELAEASNGQNPEFSTSGNLSLNQTVFSESANANISIQKSLQKAQQENYNAEELNTILNASVAYFNALILRTNVTIQNQNLELTKFNFRIASQNFESGQAGKADVLRFKSEMAQNTQELVQAINQLEQAYYELNRVLNNPIDTKIDVEEAELQDKLIGDSNYKQLASFLDNAKLRKRFVKFLVEEAYNNSPELKSLAYNLDATERSEKLFGTGRFLPTIALQGQYSYEFNRSGVGSTFPPSFPSPPEGFYNVGVNVSLPIFNQNKQNLNQQIASIQKDQINVNINAFKLSLENNVNSAVLELINQLSNIQLSKVFEASAKEALELTQTSYASGAVNIVQLLDAQNNYIQAQQASANATYNYLLSTLQLERFKGSYFLLQTEEERQDFLTRFLEFSNSEQND